jgi:hypothetical protein
LAIFLVRRTFVLGSSIFRAAARVPPGFLPLPLGFVPDFDFCPRWADFKFATAVAMDGVYRANIATSLSHIIAPFRSSSVSIRSPFVQGQQKA